MPVSADEAWGHLPPHGKGMLRELDAVHGLYEIRVNGTLRYELRRPLPFRIDVVVDRDPDSDTGVSVYVDGVQVKYPAVHTHVVDPGAAGADHEWMREHTEHDASVPESVASLAGFLARFYHERIACTPGDCVPAPATDTQGWPADVRPANEEEARNAAARPEGLAVERIAVRNVRARVGDTEFDGREIRSEWSGSVFHYLDQDGVEQNTTVYTLLPATS